MNSNEKPKDYNKYYREEFKKPLEEIKQDIFFRADNFQHEDWYGDFMIYMNIGVCHPLREHSLEIQKALKIMGYKSRITEHDGETYIVPENNRSKATHQKNNILYDIDQDRPPALV